MTSDFQNLLTNDHLNLSNIQWLDLHNLTEMQFSLNLLCLNDVKADIRKFDCYIWGEKRIANLLALRYFIIESLLILRGSILHRMQYYSLIYSSLTFFLSIATG